MTSRSDINRLYGANNRIVALVRADLERLFFSLDLTRPERARDALLELVPALVDRYGGLAGTVAAEWFETVRAQAVTGSMYATVAPMANTAEVVGSVRYAAGHLFTEEPVKTLNLLNGAVQRHVLYGSRETVRRNVGQDRSRPRWARVPAGSYTCAFCSVLASRGFAYRSETHALFSKHGNRYHDDCDCMVVPEWDYKEAHIEGYDPDELFNMFQAARGSARSADLRLILEEMRRRFPESFTDGIPQEG